MENGGKTNPQDLQIQGLLDRYLRSQKADSDQTTQKQHLDEDSLAAFTEGNLSEREAKPIISHLVECSFCRHVTAELVRLDLAFAGQDVQNAAAVENQPSKISEVLTNLLSSIFGNGDSAVFAHEEKDDDSENAENIENKKE